MFLLRPCLTVELLETFSSNFWKQIDDISSVLGRENMVGVCSYKTAKVISSINRKHELSLLSD